MNKIEGDNTNVFSNKEHLSRSDILTIIIYYGLMLCAMIVYDVLNQVYGLEKFSDLTKISKAIIISSLIVAFIILMWGALGIGFRLNKSIPVSFVTFIKKYVIGVIIFIVIVSKFVISPAVSLLVSFWLSVLR